MKSEGSTQSGLNVLVTSCWSSSARHDTLPTRAVSSCSHSYQFCHAWLVVPLWSSNADCVLLRLSCYLMRLCCANQRPAVYIQLAGSCSSLFAKCVLFVGLKSIALQEMTRHSCSYTCLSGKQSWHCFSSLLVKSGTNSKPGAIPVFIRLHFHLAKPW